MQIGSTSIKESPKMDCFPAKYEIFMVILNSDIFYLPDFTFYIPRKLSLHLFIYSFVFLGLVTLSILHAEKLHCCQNNTYCMFLLAVNLFKICPAGILRQAILA